MPATLYGCDSRDPSSAIVRCRGINNPESPVLIFCVGSIFIHFPFQQLCVGYLVR